jgi:hypothetical protein
VVPFCGKYEIYLGVKYENNLKLPQTIEPASCVSYVFAEVTFCVRRLRCHIGKLRKGYHSALVYQYQTEEPKISDPYPVLVFFFVSTFSPVHRVVQESLATGGSM